MKKVIIISFLTIFTSFASLACSCKFQGPFLKMASESQLVILATVKQTMDYTMSVSVDKVFKGKSKEIITIIGDRGDQCLESIKKFTVGNTYVFALNNQKGKYFLSHCGTYYVSVKDSKVYGMVDYTFLDYSKGSWPQYNGKTIPLATFTSALKKNKEYTYPCKQISNYIPNAYLEKHFKESKENSPKQFDYYKVNGAVSMNNLPLVEYYLEKYKIKEGKEFNDLAYTAISNGYIDILKLFIKKGLSKNVSNKYQGTLLGASGRYPELVTYLIEIGADVNKSNEREKTPLMNAASGGCVASLKILLENNAVIDAKDNKGMRAIDYAMKYNDRTKTDVIKLLKK